MANKEELSKKIKEAFEDWKADAWIRGERNENLSRMTPWNLLAYNNYLNTQAGNFLQSRDTNKVMRCINLMRQIYISAYNRGYHDLAREVSDMVNQKREALSNLNTPQERRGLFNPVSTNENLNEESFGDFIYKLLDDDQFIFLSKYCQDYVRRNITMGNSLIDKHRYWVYKRILLNKLAEINRLTEKDKSLSWEELYKKYFIRYNLRDEMKKGNIEPYKTFYLLLEKDAPGCTGFIPSPDSLIKKEKTVDESLNEEVEIHDTLNPLIWNDDNTLKPEVAKKAKEVAQIFVDILTENGIKIKVKDIHIVGSNANYNYNESSDIDIHLIADDSFDCSEKHLPLLYSAYKTLFNKKYDISFKGINVEVYVETGTSSVSGGVYSLKYDKWLKEPNKNDIPEIDQEAVGQGLNEWTKKYEEITASPTIEEIDKFIDDIYNLRINSIANEGEFSTGNLIFKEVRRNGILDDLKELKAELESKEMSLESLNEDLNIKEIEDKNTEYIEEHKENILKGYNWIKENCPEILNGCNLEELEKNINEHDLSKYSKEEFMPYAMYFFSGKKDDPKIKANFDKAWEHHYTNNKHHPEYWGNEEMPLEYIIEMICDWWTFSWKNNNLNEIFNYWEECKERGKFNFNPKTEKTLEKLLNLLKTSLSSYMDKSDNLIEEIINF